MVDRLLANDWVLRILSLLLAIGIWAQVTPSPNPNPTVVRPFTGLPVTVQNTGSLSVSTDPTTVRVELKGPAQILDAIQPSAIQVTVSSPSAAPGRYQAPVEVSAPFAGAEVIAVQPAQVTIVLTRPAIP